tara:strand:- start:172 stop:384 length:213 start_codon:yes stop_codon:yes gene_type:complete
MTTESEKAWAELNAALARHEMSMPEDKSLSRFIDSIKEDNPELYKELVTLFYDFYALCNSTSDSMSSFEP